MISGGSDDSDPNSGASAFRRFGGIRPDGAIFRGFTGDISNLRPFSGATRPKSLANVHPAEPSSAVMIMIVSYASIYAYTENAAAASLPGVRERMENAQKKPMTENGKSVK